MKKNISSKKQKVKAISTTPREIWKPIPGFKYYEASNLGRIRMLTHFERARNRWGKFIRIRQGKILRQSKRSKNRGYLQCSIKNHPRAVHRMVALAFHGVPLKGYVINHKNGNKFDNRPKNLEWVTWSQNEKHSYEVLGKQPWNKGIHYDTTKAVAVRRKIYLEKCINTLKDYKILDITQRELAEKYGLSRRQICERLKIAREALNG